jgi:UDP:flavonoid glycosyltransferase YjiC (YdhE family)
MLVVPFGGDQVANAHRVGRLGAGVHLDAAGLDPGKVGAALGEVLSPSARGRALALAAALSRCGGTAAAVDAILGVAGAPPS